MRAGIRFKQKYDILLFSCSNGPNMALECACPRDLVLGIGAGHRAEHNMADEKKEMDVESMREEVGSIAHDLNNHLTAVMGYSDILCSKLEDDATLHEYASMVAKSADVISELTQKLLVIGGRRKSH